EDSVAGFFSSLESDYGRLDVLHNNVGTAFMKATDALSLEEWRRGIDINLTSAFLTCRSAVPLMKANKGGAIINTSSIADRRWLDVPFAPYASAKAGIVQFTQTLALEYAPFGIRANVIVPGFMDTPTIVASYNDVVSGEIEAMKARRNAAVPLGHMGDAWDIARAAAFLASDDARYITGIDLVVDGGLTCSVGFKV
ncbi:MAG: SDR family NAD(P)-dependent oxidoreductase, partial [Pseudomonadota bacterium]